MPCIAQDVHVVSWREPRHAATQLALQATSSKRGSLGAGPIYVDSIDIGANWRSPALAGQRLSSSGPLELDSRGGGPLMTIMHDTVYVLFAHAMTFAATASAAGGAPTGCPVAHQRMAQVVGLVEQRLVSRGRLGRYTLEEVARHNHKDSGWVVVNGRVSRRRRRESGLLFVSCGQFSIFTTSSATGVRHHASRRHAPGLDERLRHLAAAGHPAHPGHRLLR